MEKYISEIPYFMTDVLQHFNQNLQDMASDTTTDKRFDHKSRLRKKNSIRNSVLTSINIVAFSPYNLYNTCMVSNGLKI